MKISVITASYNYANYIEETIQSVINQTYTDWELIIVDDGSTDNSLEIINKYSNQDNRIKLFTHPNNENRGLKETILLGISKAESDWIAFLESDDMWREDYLEKKVEIANKYPEVGLIFNDAECFGKIDERKRKGFATSQIKLLKKTFPRNIFKELNLENKILTFSTVMVRKDILNVDYFNTPIDKFLDWWLYVHITYKKDAYYIYEQLTKWRFHNDSYIKIGSSPAFHFIQIKAYLDLYKRENYNIKILMFIMYTMFLYIPFHCLQIKVHLARYIKKKLGLPLRN